VKAIVGAIQGAARARKRVRGAIMRSSGGMIAVVSEMMGTRDGRTALVDGQTGCVSGLTGFVDGTKGLAGSLGASSRYAIHSVSPMKG